MASLTMLKTVPAQGLDDWCTPPRILEPVHKFFGGKVDLDPCGNPNSQVKADKIFMLPKQNGLVLDWSPAKTVFMNPPYSRGQKKLWLEKAFDWKRFSTGEYRELIVLITSDTSANWWHDYVLSADRICYIRGRVKHGNSDQAAKFPSALAYWGEQGNKFAAAFQYMGHIELRLRSRWSHLV